MQNQNSTTSLPAQGKTYPDRQEDSKLYKQFLPLPYTYKYSEIHSIMDPRAWIVYETLRFYIWRDFHKANKEVHPLMEKGLIVTSLTHDKLLAKVNVGEVRTLQRQLEYLESELGWIRRYRSSPRSSTIYILGYERIIKETGEYVEEYFGDIWADHVTKEAPYYVEKGIFPSIRDTVVGAIMQTRSRILNDYYQEAGLPPYTYKALTPKDIK